MLNKLLPCPFCGAEPEKKFIGNDRTRKRSVVIKCPGCRVQRTDSAIRYDHQWVERVATDNWNRRVQ